MKTKQLPTGWKEVELKNIFDLKYGSSLPEKKREEGKIEVYGSNGIVGFHKEGITKGQTIIVGRKGSIGKINLSKNSCFPIDTTYYIDETKIPCDLNWIFYILKTLRLENLNRAAAVPGLNRNDVYSIKILLPPLPLQKKIAQILEKAEQLKQRREQSDKLTKEYLKSVFYEMFLDPNNPNNKFDKISFLDCLEKEASNNKLKIQGKDFLEKGKYPIIDQGEKFIAGYTNDKSKVYNEKLPVIIFGDHTRILKFVSFPFALGADGVKILVPKNKFDILYFYYCLKLLEIKSAGYSRHYKFLKEKKIPLPPLPLQQKFANIVEKVEKLKEKQKQSKKEINLMFDALMQKAFKGELIK